MLTDTSLSSLCPLLSTDLSLLLWINSINGIPPCYHLVLPHFSAANLSSCHNVLQNLFSLYNQRMMFFAPSYCWIYCSIFLSLFQAIIISYFDCPCMIHLRNHKLTSEHFWTCCSTRWYVVLAGRLGASVPIFGCIPWCGATVSGVSVSTRWETFG